MSDQKIFKGTVIDVEEGESIAVSCCDGLQKLNSEHIPITEGLYSGVDAGAIIKDVVSASSHNLKSGGISINTGVIVSEINLTDKTRLEAIKILMHYVNGANDDDKIYHLFDTGGYIIFAPLPDYTNETPAIELTDSEINSLTIKRKGTNYYNCATCVGADGVRAYYPQELDPEGNPIPDFPDKQYHKLINETAIIGVSACYAVARGWVRTHNQVPEEIDVSFVPDRYDFFSGQSIRINSEKRNILSNYRLREASWDYDLNKTMTLKLSNVEVFNLATYIK